MTFERKIKEISDSRDLAIAEREKMKEKLVEAIKQDQDSTELYEAYNNKSKEILWYDDEIKSLGKKRSEVRNEPIYSKTPEWQDELLAWDEVYQLLKNGNNKELLNALMERKMSVNQYKELLYFWLAENLETDEQRILRVMEGFNSWLPLKVKVWNKWNWKWTKTLNDKWTFETMIWEEYILNRISRYFSRTWITQADLKEAIKFPEWVKITKPENTEIKFECGDMKWTIKVEFTMLDPETTPQNTENPNQSDGSLDGNNSDSSTENGEQLPEKEASPKQLFDSLEQYVTGRVWGDLASANKVNIEAALQLLEREENYKEFCGISKWEEVLNNSEIKFPHSFEDFMKKIAPIDLIDKNRNFEKLVAILQSNYKKPGKSWWIVVFWPRSFRNRGYVEWPYLNDLYSERKDCERRGMVAPKELMVKIHEIEGDIIGKYYPHLRSAYFKDKVIF